MSSSSSEPTESEALVREFLAAHPALDEELGDVEVMTDRYTNAEWDAQIRQTQRVVLSEVAERRKTSCLTKHNVPASGSKDFAKTIDHTLLKLDAKESQIDALCSEARIEGFKSVCVRLNWVQRCVNNLKGSGVDVACVVGFHEGTQDTHEKAREARAAVKLGAGELDVVLNHEILTRNNKEAEKRTPTPTKRESTDTITAANTAANTRPRNGTTTTEGPYSVSVSGSIPSLTSSREGEEEIPDYSTIYTELATLRSLCPSPTVLKLILETSQLTPAQILAASHLAAAANFDFIKTSTGFNGPGAKLEDVELMVAAAEYLSTRTKSNGGSPVRGTGRRMEVKASGGIRDMESARRMIEAGATRLGTSSGVWIMQEGRMSMEKEGRPAGGVTRLYTDDSVGGY